MTNSTLRSGRAEERLMRTSAGAWKKALRPEHEHREEHDVPEPDAPARIEAEADLLRDAEDHGAGQRAPERAHAADDHGLEGEQQQQRVEIGRAVQQECRDRSRMPSSA
eukprot:TRINITY_DN18135_c0_g1_i1.p2 TRINITY_DN18135_c0_g1~~TRINITY_DN18135_c0_g1_i1.p2  ORF type:complete len:109 (+),score=33.25 TRINITY_DN18135_c0_g1_i1:106-432(+)